MVKVSKTYNCCICMKNRRTKKATLPCNHVFCSMCIKKNLKINNKCPLCRQVYTKYTVDKKDIVVRDVNKEIDLILQFCFNRRYRDKVVNDFRSNTNEEIFYRTLFLLFRVFNKVNIDFLDQVIGLNIEYMLHFVEGV